MEVTILGAGNVGLVTASCFAAAGHRIRVFDPDRARVTAGQDARSPFFEIGLDEAISGARATGHLSASTDPVMALSGTELPRICTSTSITADGESDVSQVIATEWPEYAELNWETLAEVAVAQVIYDGRRPLDRASLQHAGWRLFAVGDANPGFSPQIL